jgi:hypothetical protein
LHRARHIKKSQLTPEGFAYLISGPRLPAGTAPARTLGLTRFNAIFLLNYAQSITYVV